MWKQGLQWRKSQDNIGEPPWDYYFLRNLPESEYPKYLKKIYNYKTGESLNLKNPKTFTAKIQWIKLYGITPLMRDCTDKVKVRNYVKEKIGGEYLKPVIQICNSYDEINFDKLPGGFVIKCSHGCKWQYTVKDKKDYLLTKPFIDITRRNINGWLEQEFWCFAGFEMQYKNLIPRIIIEPLLREEINTSPREIEVYCFKGLPKIFENVRYTNKREITYYDENFNITDLILNPDDGKNRLIRENADDILKQTYDLSKNLAQDFNFVRVDWIVFNNKLYFNELTFTPFSGFIELGKYLNEKLGSMIELN